MKRERSIVDWMSERGLTAEGLAERTAMDMKIVKLIALGQYTPSPVQRRALAAALQVSPDEVSWSHRVEVSHLYGHGPQFGRSP